MVESEELNAVGDEPSAIVGCAGLTAGGHEAQKSYWERYNQDSEEMGERCQSRKTSLIAETGWIGRLET